MRKQNLRSWSTDICELETQPWSSARAVIYTEELNIKVEAIFVICVSQPILQIILHIFFKDLSFLLHI